MFAGNNSRGTYNASNEVDQAVSYVCLGKFYFVIGDGLSGLVPQIIVPRTRATQTGLKGKISLIISAPTECAHRSSFHHAGMDKIWIAQITCPTCPTL